MSAASRTLDQRISDTSKDPKYETRETIRQADEHNINILIVVWESRVKTVDDGMKSSYQFSWTLHTSL